MFFAIINTEEKNVNNTSLKTVYLVKTKKLIEINCSAQKTNVKTFFYFFLEIQKPIFLGAINKEKACLYKNPVSQFGLGRILC